jgi:hypothetical protein
VIVAKRLNIFDIGFSSLVGVTSFGIEADWTGQSIERNSLDLVIKVMQGFFEKLIGLQFDSYSIVTWIFAVAGATFSESCCDHLALRYSLDYVTPSSVTCAALTETSHPG